MEPHRTTAKPHLTNCLGIQCFYNLTVMDSLLRCSKSLAFVFGFLFLFTCPFDALPAERLSPLVSAPGAEISVFLEYTCDKGAKGSMEITGIWLIIRNNTRSSVTILWDESAFIFPGGTSSRIVHGEVRFIHTGLPQAPLPVPPMAEAREFVWPVRYIDDARLVPIVVRDNEVWRLNLVWTADGVRKSGEWQWVLSVSIQRRTVIGLSFIPVGQVSGCGDRLKGLVGINMLLGVSFRSYIPELRPGWSFYSGWGTIALLIPYVELGAIYVFPGNKVWPAIEFGLLYIIPYIGVSLYF